jgi:hypothetical protein
MSENILNDDQWVQLWEAINVFDQKGDRTILNRVLGLCIFIFIR